MNTALFLFGGFLLSTAVDFTVTYLAFRAVKFTCPYAPKEKKPKVKAKTYKYRCMKAKRELAKERAAKEAASKK